MSETLREFRCRPPWAMIFAAAYVAVVLTANGVVVAVPYYGSMFLSLGLWGLLPLLALFLLGTFGLLLDYVTVRMILWRFRPSQRIALTEDGISVPRHIASAVQVSVPYGDVTRARHTYNRWSGSIHLVSRHGRFVILSGSLSKKSDFDEILGILSERLAAVGITLESHELWFAGRWTRPQFSLRFMLFITAIVAVLLGAHSLAFHEIRSRDLAIEGSMLFLFGIPLLALVPGRKWGIAFAAGYFAGMIVEWSTLIFLIEHDMLRLIPGTFVHAGWFPLSLPVQRWLVVGAGMDAFKSMVPSLWGGCILSGILAGTIAATAWQLAARIRRRRRSRSMAAPAGEAKRL